MFRHLKLYISKSRFETNHSDRELMKIIQTETKETLETIKELTKILSRLGISLTMDDTYSDSELYKLSLTYDSERIKEKITRKAGRKRNYKLNPENLTWIQVETLLEKNSKEIVAKRLGMNRTTLYRRLLKKPKWDYENTIF